MKNVLIVAAENSAEHYGAGIIKKFKDEKRDVAFFGAGGDEFQKNGVEIVVHNRELSIVGIIEVLSSIFRLKRIMGKLIRTAKEKNAAAAILIDYPDFNLRLARKLKKAGIPVYYYISPTVWAWRYSRVNIIRKYVDHMFIIFPFEKEIYEREKIPFTYTGHPLLPSIRVDTGREKFRRDRGIGTEEKILALLPGSRASEVRSLLPVMLETVKSLSRENNVKPVLLKAGNIDRDTISEWIRQSGQDVMVIDQKDRYDLFNASDAALASCGTSNLELAVCGLPFVAVYKVNGLSYLLGKKFLKISKYSIVNILLGKGIVEEWIQKDLTVSNCLRSIRSVLYDKQAAETQRSEFGRLRSILSVESPPSEIIYKKLGSLIFHEK